MAKKRLNNWDEVDDAIRRMGELDIALERIQGEATMRINQIREEAKQKSAPLNSERKELEKAVQAFCESHKDEFSKKRSKVFNYGTIGYRLVRSVPIPKDKDKVAALLKSLKAFGLTDCIKVEEKPDRDKIAEQDDATIAKLGLKRTVKDSFRVQPDVERIQDTEESHA